MFLLIFTFCLLHSISALFSSNWSTLHLYQKLEEKFGSFGNYEFGTLVLSVFWWKVCWHVKWDKTNSFSLFLFSSIGKRMLIRLLTLFQPFEPRRKSRKWSRLWLTVEVSLLWSVHRNLGLNPIFSLFFYGHRNTWKPWNLQCFHIMIL